VSRYPQRDRVRKTATRQLVSRAAKFRGIVLDLVEPLARTHTQMVLQVSINSSCRKTAFPKTHPTKIEF